MLIMKQISHVPSVFPYPSGVFLKLCYPKMEILFKYNFEAIFTSFNNSSNSEGHSCIKDSMSGMVLEDKYNNCIFYS